MEIEIMFTRGSARFEAEDILEARDWLRRLGRSTSTLDHAKNAWRTFAEAMSSEQDIAIFDAVTASISDEFLVSLAAEKAARLTTSATKYAAAPTYVAAEYDTADTGGGGYSKVD